MQPNRLEDQARSVFLSSSLLQEDASEVDGVQVPVSPLKSYSYTRQQVDGLDFTKESDRRKSFYAGHWPSWAGLSPHQLASEGFYYLGIRDDARCFSCNVLLRLWKPDDNIRERHRKASPSCPFLMMKDRESESHYLHQRLAAPETNQEMEEEVKRLSTFSHGWPSYCSVKPGELAQSGFFYTGHDDSVQCFSCRIALKGWERGDTAEGEHRRHNPFCPFLIGKDERNVPLNASRQQQPQRQETLPSANLQFEHARIQTFNYWPQDLPVSPDDLAEAGFYYTGDRDLVRCFHCSVSVDQWVPGDIPVEEHIKHSPDCSFAKAVARRKQQLESHMTPNPQATAEVMKDYQHRLASFKEWPQEARVSATDLATAGFYFTGSGDGVRCFSCGGALKGWLQGDTAWGEHAKYFPSCQHVQQHAPMAVMPSYDEPWSQPVQSQRHQQKQPDVYIQQAVEMGFPEQLATQVKTQQQTMFDSFEGFLELLLAEQNKTVAAAPGDSQSATSIQQTTLVPTAPPDTQDMHHELKQLQESRLCKICMEKEATILFMPCAHILCCQKCADNAHECPVCRTEIQSRIRSYFA